MKRPTDKPIHIVAKSAMTAVYLWSGFFWSGVAILNFWLNDPSDSHLSVGFLAGSLILLASLILCWLRLYILQIIPCIAGLAVYLKPAREMMDKAARLGDGNVFAIGNAPTALIRLYELITADGFKPAAVIGVPVGFVNVVRAKELIMTANVPYIAARGRKGGSSVAAAICNAILYEMK